MTELVTLEKVALINPRPNKTLAGDDIVSFLSMADVETDGTTTGGAERAFGDVSKGYTQFEKGDVLVAKITPCFENGKIAQAVTNHPRAAGSTEFHVVRAMPGILDPRYLHHFLRQSSIRIEGERRMTGSAGQRRVPQVYLAGLRIPVPPLVEQKRIAGILDQIEALLAKRRQSILLLDALMQSIFYDLFDKEMNFQAECRLQDVAEIVSGITKGRKVPVGVPLRNVPYLAVANVQDMRLELSSVKTIDASAGEIERYRLRKNDLLLTEGGDPDKLGRGTLWREEMPEVIHQNHIFRVRPLSRDVNPVFLNWYMSSAFGKAYFLRSAKQTTGIASINSTQLKNFPLRLPSIRKQEEFSEKIARVDENRFHCEMHLQALDGLFGSLQARAFRGEL